jgi:nucleoside-diphosphate-sugar epimerase
LPEADFHSMKISVYGSTGFIGKVFCKMYPADVVAVSRDDRKPKSSEILYLISTTSNYNVFESTTIDVDTNLRVFTEVLSECKRNDITINYISSGFVYGNDIINAAENDYCDPRGFYSITKRAAEQLLISFCETFDVKYRILRLANVYGTEDIESSGKKNALGYLIGLLKENKDVNLYDGGDVLRDYLHVEDVCAAIKLVIDKGETNSIYNIASGRPLKFYDIIMIAKDYLSSDSAIKAIETPGFYKQVQAKNFSLNVKKLKALGFKENMPIEKGIKLLCH